MFHSAPAPAPAHLPPIGPHLPCASQGDAPAPDDEEDYEEEGEDDVSFPCMSAVTFSGYDHALHLYATCARPPSRAACVVIAQIPVHQVQSWHPGLRYRPGA